MYTQVLIYIQTFLEACCIRSCLLNSNSSLPIEFDSGLRKFLYGDVDYQKITRIILDQYQTKTIYFLTDVFGCRYVLLHLPDGSSLFVGPYSYVVFDDALVYRLTRQLNLSQEKFTELKDYYLSLPLFEDEERFILFFQAFAEIAYGGPDSYSIDFIRTAFDEQILYGNYLPEADSDSGDLVNIEVRYQLMCELLNSVRTANISRATQMLNQFLSSAPKRRFSNALKDTKNWLIVFNTSLRMTAEQAGVHPFYLDKLSQKFSYRIDALSSPDRKAKFMHDMMRQYCQLITNHTESRYPMMIQRILLLIEYDLTADLSLNALARQLNVNASYLSSLFKKAMNTTLTEYVNKKRVDASLLYLNSTDLQVQMIGQKVGINDPAYFTKLFRQHIGMSPTEYRNEIQRRQV